MVHGDTLPRASIFDFDGTLCDVRSILRLMPPVDVRSCRDLADWDAYHQATLTAPPLWWVHALARVEAEMGHAVIVVTAREERWRQVTSAWLDLNPIPHTELCMRRQGDTRRDAAVKADILADLRSRYDVRLAVEDRPSVVAFWKAAGIPTVTVPYTSDQPAVLPTHPRNGSAHGPW